ncbi:MULTISPECIES: sucrose-specific PTS transporter subunit IIBC [Haemophilus]|jgi:PTS system sucrose-specific IIBC component|uniref:protein-N(pi)-phosphohistidine--sucrose phosphotransferase n=2 Tax=Haemophilus TaxID=724 RepID=A0A502JP24_HAEHA|nr:MULTISPECIES: sucrose-specific PTS transporter subunit IIBC [Haemophilus]KAA5523851.1 PTS sucrose transporter subunit IIBC [Haemophilus seminalis]MBS6046761.1 sucrose-specific PTS transporter subunit IIBC [Haemophilus haemolyticus]MDK7280102.1 sucrose-specific PTS transporter subunit IIBC [Haemophilus seminalis]TPH00846.1 PTS maltose transporter subunit IIBC [Haemophilus haemolyticus]
MNFPKIAEQVIEKLGGKNNIATAAHCATRLRIVLNDESKVDKEGIEAIEGVKGQFSVAGQYQIIFGSGTVNKVHEQLTKQLGIGDVSKAEVAEAALGQQNLLQRIVKGLADIFVPIIPAIVAGGLLMGLYSMLTSIGFFWDNHSVVTKYPEISDLVDFINTIANAPFVFLPVLLGFSATRKFGGNPFLGAALGMLLVHPSLSDGWNYAKTLMEGNIKYWNVFGLEIEKVGYQGTVIPTIISAWVLATLEKNFRKFIPSYLDNLITPMFSLFIAGFLAFTVIGPFGREAGSLISAGLAWLYDTLGFFGGAIFGTLYAPIVITGMHQTFIAVETQLLAEITQTGGTFIFPIAAMSNIAQGAACLGVALALKDAKIRGLAVPSGISALLGITEPAMFGINLRYRQAFIAAMIGSGLASAFIAFFNVKAIALGAAGFLGIPSIKPDSLAMYSIGMVISFVVAFSLSFLFVKRAHTK